MVRLADIVRLVNGSYVGDINTPIKGAATLDEATPEDISFAAEPKYLEQAKLTRAAAVIVPRDFPNIERPVIRVSNARLAWTEVLELMAPEELIPLGVHETAAVGEDVEMGKDVSVQAHVVLGNRVKLGDRVVLYPGVYIGEGTQIGDDTVVYPNVTLRERVLVGKRCIIHSGVVIGSDGFGFVPTAHGQKKVPHIGSVVIEDDVEIGANTTVDRGTTGATVVGEGTKIDNLVQIGHNAKLGRHCLVAAMSGIAGSSVLQDRVTMAGQTGTAGHLTVGEGTVIMARGLVAGDTPPRAVVSGFPARSHPETMRIIGEQRRLPQLRRLASELKKQVTTALAAKEELKQQVQELERMVERTTADQEQLKERLAALERRGQ